jgi:hypothetical protein
MGEGTVVRVLSVDLGTSNTVAVLSAHGRPPRVVEIDGSATMPSAVFAGDDGELVVGREAERRARLDPARFEPNPKRRIDEGTLLLGDRVLPVTDVLAAVLRRVADETTRQLGGSRPDEVRLTHPAQWGPVRRTVLLSAARQAGLGPNLVLVPEPVAAAAHFASFAGRSLSPGQALAVYDLGAGTFDVAIVGATDSGFVVLAEAGLPDLGGLDVDHALLEQVGRQAGGRDPARWHSLLRPASTADRRAARALREDVKAAKEALSSHPQADVALPEPFDDVLVTRAELEGLIRPSLLRSVELLSGAIRSTGRSPDRLAGIYLVGGSSRIPLIATLIARSLRIMPTNLDQPETAVALGAHHVTGEGTGLRTRNLATTQGPPTPVVAGPHPGPPPPPVGPRPGYPTAYPPRPQPRPSSRKPLLIGLAVLAVAAIATVATISLTANSDPGPGGDPATDTSPCAGQRPDGQGWTGCLRELAGSVAEKGTCKPSTTSATANTTVIATVSCGLPDGSSASYLVQYVQLGNGEMADRQLDAAFDSLSGGQQTRDSVEPTTWSGAGMTGQQWTWVQQTPGGDMRYALLRVDDRPLLVVFAPRPLIGQKPPSPDEVAVYFDENVKPGA